MPASTVTLGILRHPLAQLRSSIAFHGLAKPMRLTSSRDVIAEFLSKPKVYDARAKFTGGSLKCKPTLYPSFTRNEMAYHFGYVQQSNNSLERITRFIETIDESIDLMLILEQFDESMILLKRMFHWSMQDIASLTLNNLASRGKKPVRSSHGNEEELIQKHKKWSTADYHMYEYFAQKLNNTLSAQSADFFEEVDRYRQIKLDIRNHCKQLCDLAHFNKIKVLIQPAKARDYLQSNVINITRSTWNEGFQISHIDCLALALGTQQYHAAVNTKQVVKNCSTGLQNQSNLPRCSDDKAKYIVYTFQWSTVKAFLLKSPTVCRKYFE